MIIAWHTFETTLEASSSLYIIQLNFIFKFRLGTVGRAADRARAREKLFFQFSRGSALNLHHAAMIRYFLTISGENRIINNRDCRWTATVPGEKWHGELISQPRWLNRRWISHNLRREMWATLFSNCGRDCRDALASRRRQCATEPHIN